MTILDFICEWLAEILDGSDVCCEYLTEVDDTCYENCDYARAQPECWKRYFVTRFNNEKNVVIGNIMQNMEEKEVKLCVRCKHVYGLAQFPEKGFPCRECFEQEHWEQKGNLLSMCKIIHTTLLGQDGNEGIEQEVINGFASKEEAQNYIDEYSQKNGWHRYEIVDNIL